MSNAVNIPLPRASQTHYLVGSGDSIAAPYLLPSWHSYQRYAADRLGGVSWAAVGHSGQRTDQIYSTFATDMIAKKPTIAIIEGGTNDPGTLTAQQSADNLKAMVDDCDSDGVPIIVFIPIPPNLNLNETQQGLRDDINDITVPWFQSEYPDQLLVNVDDIFESYTFDGLHPSKTANRLIGERIGDAIIATLEKTIVAEKPQLFIARETRVWADLPFDASNTRIIYKAASDADYYVPGTGGTIDGLEEGEGYMIIAKEALDLSAFAVPKFDRI